MADLLKTFEIKGTVVSIDIKPPTMRAAANVSFLLGRLSTMLNLNRREVAADGLRGIAILPVLFYQYDIGPFSADFVGIDIFFVISGYLITQLIHVMLSVGCFSIADHTRSQMFSAE